MANDNVGFNGMIGTGGANNKGKNAVKLEANMRREQAKNNQQDGEPAEKFPIPEDYGDGSIINFIWTTTHKRLLELIIAQTEDDCWAWALVRILQFFHNKDISVVAQQTSLSIKSLVKYVILGMNEAKEPGAQKKLKKKSLAVSSLKRAIDYILNVGIERDYGTQMNKIKAIFLTKPNATPADIKGLLFRELKNVSEEIYIVHEPREGMNRHVRFDHRWIIIEKTCPIFYVGELVK
ncbi:unnamed protein product [Brassica napus]|uniref:(rape) hypothetical protein n=1 Tax=Brassica napus TaxID=3708 RepID=A0A816J7I2_BRANA|nr:unnamed protein product [Brassica napus]